MVGRLVMCLIHHTCRLNADNHFQPPCDLVAQFVPKSFGNFVTRRRCQLRRHGWPATWTDGGRPAEANTGVRSARLLKLYSPTAAGISGGNIASS